MEKELVGVICPSSDQKVFSSVYFDFNFFLYRIVLSFWKLDFVVLHPAWQFISIKCRTSGMFLLLLYIVVVVFVWLVGRFIVCLFCCFLLYFYC